MHKRVIERIGIFVSIVFALALIASSGSELFYTLNWQPLKRLAERLETGETLSFAHAASFKETRHIDRFDNRCKLRERRSVLSFYLNAADAADRAQRPVSDIDSAYDNALGAARQTLKCTPVDGNAWLLLSVIEMRFIGSAPEVLEKIDYSYWTAPNEDWIMEARIRALSRLAAAGLDDVAPKLEREIVRYAEYAPIGATIKLYDASARPIRPIYFAAAKRISAKKSDALVSALQSRR